MFVYTKEVNQALLTWFTSIRGNNIPINGPLLLELANLLAHLIATLSRHQTDGLENGKRYVQIYILTFENSPKESGLQSEKYCQ